MRKANVISFDDNIKGGTPVIAGTRITVRSIIYLHKRLKKSPSIIATKYYTQLSVDQINDVISMYEQNVDRYVGLGI